MPELRRRLPELPPTDEGDSETERYRLFEAVVGLLRNLSASMSVLIVIDDLHWADRPTLMLLRHLARSPRPGRLSIIGAYRLTERGSEGFSAALQTLRHERSLKQIELAGLPERDAARLVSVRVGRAPSADFSRALYDETEGNPFFIEEMLRHLEDSGVEVRSAGAYDLQRFGLPDDVREVISRRLARLGANTVETMRVASVIGREFDSGLLEDVLALDEESFLGALDEALGTGLVGESPTTPGRLSFSHALIRETLYEGMWTARRARIHRRVGVALEQRGETSNTNALAHHFTRAADPEYAKRAIDYALEAGEQAAAMLAHEQAADHYARALEVLEQFEPEAEQRRCELLLAARRGPGPQRRAPPSVAGLPRGGCARRPSGRRRRARPRGDRCVAALPAAARSRRPRADRDARPGAHDDQRRTDRDPRPAALGPVRGALLLRGARPDGGSERRAATEIAAALDDPRATALAAAARRRAYWDPDHLEQRLSDSGRLVRAATEAGDIELVLQGHAWLAVDLLEQGDVAGVDAQVQAFSAGARELRQPLYLWQVAVWRAMRALLAGHLSTAERLASEAFSAGIRPESETATPVLRDPAARDQARAAANGGARGRRSASSSPTTRTGRRGATALATLMIETGRLPEAQAELDLLAADQFAEIPRDGDWIVAMVLLADVAASVNDAERAAILHDLLLPFRDRNVVIGLGTVCLGSVARYLGRLAAAFGDQAIARGHFERAVEANRNLHASLQLAHTQLDYARALGAGPKAKALVEAASHAAEELHLPSIARRGAEIEGRLGTRRAELHKGS